MTQDKLIDLSDPPAPVNPNTINSRNRRARLAQEGLGEVRGITAPKELHDQIRRHVDALLMAQAIEKYCRKKQA